MTTQDKPADIKTILSLSKKMNILIQDHEKLALAELHLIKSLDENEQNSTFIAILRLHLYVNFINIELMSTLRSTLTSSELFEKRYHLKHINTIILEAYKHLYGYSRDHRRKSLWRKLENSLDSIDNEGLINEFNLLNSKVEAFAKSNVTSKEQRDLAIHYDADPTLVYEMLMSLDENEEAKRFGKFWDLLLEIFTFSTKHMGTLKNNIVVKKETEAISSSNSELLQLYSNLLEPKLYSSLVTFITFLSGELHKYIKILSLPEKLRNHYDTIDSSVFEPIDRFVEIVTVSIQLIYLYIDLASATKSFLDSEHVVEKQIAMKQIHIIIYEGYNKLYGIDHQKDKSFFEKYLQPFITLLESESDREKLILLEQNLANYEQEVIEFKEERHLFVHYDEGIESVYSFLREMCPTILLERTTVFLNLLTEILNSCTNCIAVIDRQQSEVRAANNKSMNDTINKILSLLEKQPASKMNEKLKEELNSIQLLVDSPMEIFNLKKGKSNKG